MGTDAGTDAHADAAARTNTDVDAATRASNSDAHGDANGQPLVAASPSPPPQRRLVAATASLAQPPTSGVNVAPPSPAPPPTRESQLLLVSLLENFCSLYDRRPQRHRLLFFRICQQLASMGLISAHDFMDETATVRSAYKQAFKDLVGKALVDINKKDGHGQRRLSSGDEGGASRGARARQRALRASTDSHSGDCESDDCAGDDDADTTDASDQQDIDETTSRAPFDARWSREFAHQFTFYQSFLSSRSRYYEDFIELRVLGRGAYGVVTHARNKLDGIDYAVKKISLKMVALASHEKVLREARYLARLDHPNIVRYHASWLEFDHSATSALYMRDGDDGLHGATDKKLLEYHRRDSWTVKDELRVDYRAGDTERDDDFSVEFAHSVSEECVESAVLKQDSCNMPAAHDRLPTAPVTSNGSSTIPEIIANRQPPSLPDGVNRARATSFLQPSTLTLCIQMNLCLWTLRDWLDARNEYIFRRTSPSPPPSLSPGGGIKKASTADDRVAVHSAECMHLFRGIVEAIAYVHGKSLIHRDLKPSNIFFSPADDSASDTHSAAAADPFSPTHAANIFSSDDFVHRRWTPKLGDFGLVTQQDLDVDDGDRSDGNASARPVGGGLCKQSVAFSSGHTRDVGTALYAAPEQLDRTAATSTATDQDATEPDAFVNSSSRLPARYDEKVDVYALGIILLELFCPFQTTMERVEVVTKLRTNRKLPPAIMKRWPKHSELIIQCTTTDPENRPSARELLDHELLNTTAAGIVEKAPLDTSLLVAENARLRQENERLRRLLARHNISDDDNDHAK